MISNVTKAFLLAFAVASLTAPPVLAVNSTMDGLGGGVNGGKGDGRAEYDGGGWSMPDRLGGGKDTGGKEGKSGGGKEGKSGGGKEGGGKEGKSGGGKK